VFLGLNAQPGGLIRCRRSLPRTVAKGRGASFFAPALTEAQRQGVPVDGREPTGHDETVLTVPSPGKDCELLVMMK
jgi:hypothetical protein